VSIPPEAANSLAMALVASSQAPLVLLDDELDIIAVSNSFRFLFQVQPDVVGRKLADLGNGEWDVPQLNSLLRATVSGVAAIDAYEMDLVRNDHKPRRLVLRADKLDYFDADNIRIMLSVTDVTEARLAEKLKDDLIREKQILLQELQHRVANSLQIIASVLLQSARRVQSDETRTYLHDAHHRVMSIATMQKQLAVSRLGDVELRPYFAELCRSIGASMIRDHNRLSLTATVDDSAVTADVSVSLGLIVTELVINALKHAFPGHDPVGKITVDYASHEGGWMLSVGDNGAGMPADPSAKPGLGTGIVEALSRQLDARVTVSDAKPGTRVSIAHAEHQ
jgi:two-component system, sensor histidine kinase PdtaS